MGSGGRLVRRRLGRHARTRAGTTILRAPEPLCELLLERLPGRVAIEETPGQWEYLYTQEALSTLAGNKLHKKKNHVNGYMKAYGEDYRALNGEIMPQVLALQDDWCKWRECEKSASLLAESDVVCSVLRNWDALPGLIGGALYAGEEMAAFAVGEPLDDQTIVVHFEKGRPGYRGVYQVSPSTRPRTSCSSTASRTPTRKGSAKPRKATCRPAI